MRRITVVIFVFASLLGLSACTPATTRQPTMSHNNNTTVTEVPVEYSSLVERVWDWRHPDDSEINPHFSISVDSLGGASIEHRKDGKIYVDGELLFGGPGHGCESFYLADITGDGKPELCFGMNWGSGIVDCRIEIFDYEAKECVYSLTDRMKHDYYLFARNGVLCVMETEYMKLDAIRTGILVYDGTEISVSWDNKIDASYDREN